MLDGGCWIKPMGLGTLTFSPRRSEENEEREDNRVMAFSSLTSFSSFLRCEKASNVTYFDLDQTPASSIYSEEKGVMRFRSVIIASLLFTPFFLTASAAVDFQQGPGRGPIAQPRDPELEKQSYHSLEVAKFYFYKRKPDKKDVDGWARLNKSIEGRLLEIIDTNPTFARMDDVYFMLGEVYKRMGESGKAVDHWTKALKETSDEKIKVDAQKRLDETKAQGKEKKG
jgi:hypothetical protein